MLEQYSKYQAFIYTHSKVILTFVSKTSPVLVEYFSSLSQPVTSQAENNEPLEWVLIVFVIEYTSESPVFMVCSFHLSQKNYSIHDN